jgi:hypothetical protein
MIATIALTLAIAPCGIPPKAHHRKPVLAQTCVAPQVPMCFRDPAPEPDIAPMPDVLPYYINTPVADDGTQGEGPYIDTSQIITPAPTGYSYPPAPVPRSPTPHAAPELGATQACGALTLLLGSIAMLKGRRV